LLLYLSFSLADYNVLQADLRAKGVLTKVDPTLAVWNFSTIGHVAEREKDRSIPEDRRSAGKA
jgi:hypothetical protein